MGGDESRLVGSWFQMKARPADEPSSQSITHENPQHQKTTRIYSKI